MQNFQYAPNGNMDENISKTGKFLMQCTWTFQFFALDFLYENILNMAVSTAPPGVWMSDLLHQLFMLKINDKPSNEEKIRPNILIFIN